MILSKILQKKALITGASRGIGLGIARKLLVSGFRVVLVARGYDVLELLKNEMNGDVEVYPADLTDKEQLNGLIGFLQNTGIPDVIVHNLGGRINTDTQPLSYDAFMQSMDFNLGVAVAINHWVLPFMQKNKKGHILHISSDSALNGNGAPGYVASKAALNAYIRSTARFYVKDNVCINGVMPGIVEFPDSAWNKKRLNDTERYFQVKARQSLGRFSTVEEVADFVAMLIQSENILQSGEIFLINGGGAIE